MARYSKVERSTWGDERFRALSPAPPNAQTLWLYLITGPHNTSVPGLFRLRLSVVSEELGWDYAETCRVFEELVVARMVEHDRRAGLMWLPKALKYNAPQSPNVVAGWRDDLSELPECELRGRAVAALRGGIEALGSAYRTAIARALGEAPPMPSPNPSGGKGSGRGGPKALVGGGQSLTPAPDQAFASDGPKALTMGTPTPRDPSEAPAGVGQSLCSDGAKPLLATPSGPKALVGGGQSLTPKTTNSRARAREEEGSGARVHTCAREESPTAERPAAAQPKPPAAEPKPPRPKPAAAEAARVEEPAAQPTTAAATTDLAPKTEIDPAEVLDTLVAETGAALDVGDGVSAETLARAVLERVSEPGLSVAQLLGRVRRVGRVLARPAEAFPRWDLVQRSGRISARLLLARGGSALGDAVALAQRRASEQQPSTHRRFPGGEVFLRTDGPKATPEDYRAAMEPLRARLQALSAASGLDG